MVKRLSTPAERRHRGCLHHPLNQNSFFSLRHLLILLTSCNVSTSFNLPILYHLHRYHRLSRGHLCASCYFPWPNFWPLFLGSQFTPSVQLARFLHHQGNYRQRHQHPSRFAMLRPFFRSPSTFGLCCSERKRLFVLGDWWNSAAVELGTF